MTRFFTILAFAYRLRRARRLMTAGDMVEAERVLSALDREHRIG